MSDSKPRGRPKNAEPPRTVLSAKVSVRRFEEICRAAQQSRMTVSAFVNDVVGRALANSGKR